MKDLKTWNLPFKPNEKYTTKVAYFCMEFAIDQSLKIYSGGLGFLAGSHMRSAYELKQNLIGVGILWKYGYYDQVRNEDQTLRVQFTEKHYSFLEETGHLIPVTIKNNRQVFVKVYLLKGETFGTAPIYLLSTDIPENDHLSQTITHRLYDNNPATRVAQSIVLGIGGAKLMQELGGADIYHMNEGHALPLVFYLYEKLKNWEDVRKKVVFTTHTPEKAGNEEHYAPFLNEMGFFKNTLTQEQLEEVTHYEASLNYTVTALRNAKLANGVSKLHGEVSRKMWSDQEGICEIISITNSQNKSYWGDKELSQHFEKGNNKAFINRKKAMKTALFQIVADQCGKLFDPDILTIVWARRFAAYKRPDLLLRNNSRFKKLVNRTDQKVQIIWAGKPYPLDNYAINTFNHLVSYTRDLPNCAVLTGYELHLSRLLKYGADVWLNTPRRPREASGTSGMTASMNAAVNFSIFDGWICEFTQHGKNGFIIPPVDETLPEEEQDWTDCQNMYQILEDEIIPIYYNEPQKWLAITKQSMQDVAEFESSRMADEYYEKLYNF
ncbi:MAG: alpha-glucan family phosphorylase [Microscillaceae bacterium]|nr:alpha-glucan family phosphorylase [Microscillaceae bacterium]